MLNIFQIILNLKLWERFYELYFGLVKIRDYSITTLGTLVSDLKLNKPFFYFLLSLTNVDFPATRAINCVCSIFVVFTSIVISFILLLITLVPLKKKKNRRMCFKGFEKFIAIGPQYVRVSSSTLPISLLKEFCTFHQRRKIYHKEYYTKTVQKMVYNKKHQKLE